MNEQNKIINIALLGAVLIGTLIFVFFKMLYIDWDLRLNRDTNEPYDVSIFQDYLKQSSETFIEIDDTSETVLDTLLGESITYILIDQDLNYDSAKSRRIREFAERGNEVLISTRRLYKGELELLFNSAFWTNNDKEYYSSLFIKSDYDTIAKFQFNNQDKFPHTYDYKFVRERKAHFHNWKYFNNELQCVDYNWNSLSYMNNDSFPNYIEFQIGRGKILLHASPEIFTNYYIYKDIEHQKHIENVLSYTTGKHYIIDHNLVQPYKPRENSKKEDNSNGYKNGDLRIIHNHKGLTAALYVILISTFLYLFFNAKRRQRVIPNLVIKENTSKNFIKTVSRLYFLNNAHRAIGKHLWIQFLDHLKSKYNVRTEDDLEILQENILVKTKVPSEELELLIEKYKGLDYLDSISSSYLLDFYKQIRAINRKLKL